MTARRIIKKYWQSKDLRHTLYQGDCLHVLKSLPDASVDSVVTDPPAGISFMGKTWDQDKGGRAKWVEWMQARAEQALRVLKPGGHALVWALPRTSHWTATAWEDAGFEVRDRIVHCFGSGFPKSLNVGKAIDKSGGDRRVSSEMKIAFASELRKKRQLNNISKAELAAWFPQYSHITANWERQDAGFRVPTEKDYLVLVEKLGMSSAYIAFVRSEDKRIKLGSRTVCRSHDGSVLSLGHTGEAYDVSSNTAKQWSGWGTALKPAIEDWWLLRKPFEGTIADNVCQYGTGALNIEACRIPLNGDYKSKANGRPSQTGPGDNYDPKCANQPDTVGRWPANLTHDGTSEIATLSASRFFYCAKANRSDRGPDNKHPTVKSTELMRYLCRLITPRDGLVLDPFFGSGSTGKAAVIEGFRFIGIEGEKDYCDTAIRRVEQELSRPRLHIRIPKPKDG